MFESIITGGGVKNNIANIAGALFGALRGVDRIPVKFQRELSDTKKILSVGRKFFNAAR